MSYAIKKLNTIYNDKDLAWYILSLLCNCTIGQLLFRSTIYIHNFDIILRRLERGISVHRLLGFRRFWKHDFHISPYTFEPRPETEKIIEYVKQCLQPKNILDIGVGTGAILLSLLYEFPNSKGTGVDISPYALITAKYNAEQNCINSTTFCNHIPVNKYFDLVVYNPPYVEKNVDKTTLYDPPVALFGNYKEYLKPVFDTNIIGKLVMEVPVNQIKCIVTHLKDNFVLEHILCTSHSNIKIIVFQTK